jgi:Xaa-Pro aminopeptidase
MRAPEVAAADRIVTYEAKWHSTLRNDQRAASSQVLIEATGARNWRGRVGVEYSSFGLHLAREINADWVDIEPDLYRLRRRKDPDELRRLAKAIAGTGRMYERARQIIRPGILELDVFNQLQSAAVEEFGEMMTATGNDYRCGARGGPPRHRAAQEGELYILDLGPAFRGYFADNSRTIAVGEPSQQQQQAWELVTAVFRHIERTARPGTSARALFHEAEAMLGEAPIGVFNHHLGHGIGLFPHEAPHLNPDWNDTLEVGDVFTAEPGLYAPELKSGMRIENNYLVTPEGVELLSDFPLPL